MAERVIIPPETLRKLSREERIKRLRELEEERKKNLEERKQELEERKQELEAELQKTSEETEAELAAAEELIGETEREFVDEALREAAERDRRQREAQREQEGLEARVAEAPAAELEAGRTYAQPATPGGLYEMMREDAERLNDLANATNWDLRQQEMYREINERIDRIRQYKLGEELEESFGILTGARKRLDYRR
jgi:vacuolar-type H+-ATPase subunit I/STV1